MLSAPVPICINGPGIAVLIDALSGVEHVARGGCSRSSRLPKRQVPLAGFRRCVRRSCRDCGVSDKLKERDVQVQGRNFPPEIRLPCSCYLDKISPWVEATTYAPA